MPILWYSNIITRILFNFNDLIEPASTRGSCPSASMSNISIRISWLTVAWEWMDDDFCSDNLSTTRSMETPLTSIPGRPFISSILQSSLPAKQSFIFDTLLLWFVTAAWNTLIDMNGCRFLNLLFNILVTFFIR